MLIAATSEGWCFLIDGISYIAVIASLLAMRINVPQVLKTATSMAHELHEGLDLRLAIPAHPQTSLLLFAVVSLMGMPFVVLMPIFAARVLHGGPHTLGFLMGAMGVGALASALSLAARKTVRGLIRIIPVSAVVFAIGPHRLRPLALVLAPIVAVLIAGMGMMQGMAPATPSFKPWSRRQARPRS